MGETVEEFASENATVVVGTVIDPDLTDELRVTVVATGLGESEVIEEPKPTKVVDNTAQSRAPETSSDYRELDRPTVSRQAGNAARKLDSGENPDMDYLDIQAFLRRQAD